jgi:hypothetical protein
MIAIYLVERGRGNLYIECVLESLLGMSFIVVTLCPVFLVAILGIARQLRTNLPLLRIHLLRGAGARETDAPQLA